jgi:hypothetical protein
MSPLGTFTETAGMRGRSGLSRMIVVVTLAGGALRFKATRDGRRVVATRSLLRIDHPAPLHRRP